MSTTGGGPPEEQSQDVGRPESSSVDPPPPAAVRRGQRKRLQKAAEDELADWRFLEAHPPGQAIRVRAHGSSIGDDSGELGVVGAVMSRLGRLYETLTGSAPWLDHVEFGHSVDIYIRPSPDEIAAAASAMRIAHGLRSKGVPDDDPRMVKVLREAVAEVHVSTALAADLLSASPEDAPERARHLGSAVAAAYKSLATEVARDELTVEISDIRPDAGAEPVRLGAQKARRISEALREPTEPTKVRVVALGTLSIADAIMDGFGLLLDPGSKRPDELKGKRLVRGTFTGQVEAKIRDENLWGKQVRATIEVERDALFSSSTIRPPSYILIDIEARA